MNESQLHSGWALARRVAFGHDLSVCVSTKRLSILSVRMLFDEREIKKNLFGKTEALKEEVYVLVFAARVVLAVYADADLIWFF